jgi:hypothetical protein
VAVFVPQQIEPAAGCSSRFQVHTGSSSTVLKARRPPPCIFGSRIPEIQIYGVLSGSTA